MGEVQIASPGPPTRVGDSERSEGGREGKSESIEIGAAERTAGTRPRFTLHGHAVQWRPLRDPGPKRVEILTKMGIN